jgi:2-oxoglutarate decarboxylase
VRTIELALEFRRAFQKDVVVDMIGYRRWGHNEADEPAYTQPLMYARIAEHRSVRKLYTEKLVNRGDLSLEEADAALGGFQKLLEDAFAATKESAPPEVCLLTEEPPPEPLPPPPPAVPREVLERVLAAATTVPAVFHVHPKLARQLALRAQALALDAVDWGTAELLAFGSLLLEGKPVRLTGQDSRRGTFSHRHAVLVDQQTGADLVPLQHLDPDQAPFALYDSMLSEYAGLGFEYGYSLGRPDALVLWEAQFGDFVNGAQIVIDQLLAAAEEKWDQHSRLGLLLPHGHEGQGPEHSSARLERFLQLCAADNLRVVVPSTAGQYFHLLRSQAHLEHAKPLVVLTPKSLLRLQAARSTAADLCAATFQPVLADPDPPTDPTRLVLGCGKVAHDLLAARAQHAGKRVSIVRVEQLFPFPDVRLGEIVRLLPALTELVWAQEEPRNMGAWSFVAPRLTKLFSGISLRYVGRPSSPSPATGSARVHEAEQERLVTHALQG